MWLSVGNDRNKLDFGVQVGGRVHFEVLVMAVVLDCSVSALILWSVGFATFRP